MKEAEVTAEILAEAEQSYDQLDGEWAEWLAVAKRYEHKVPSQDRYDIRHTILIELAHARQRDGKPLPILRAYRIASLTVALYWREVNKAQVKVCVYSGLPIEPHCKTCQHSSNHKDCCWLAVRPVQSLDSELGDDGGDILADTIADDHAIDLDAWLDAKTWLLGCPIRLVQIAKKRRDGLLLNEAEDKYLDRFRKKDRKQMSLF